MQKAAVSKPTGETNGHTHTAEFDDQTGMGTTSVVNGHSHRIVDFKVQGAGGHTHSLSVSQRGAKKMEKVEIRKVDLLEGEELNQLIKKVASALTKNKGKIGKSLGLVGIYKDFVIARDFETGRHFKMKMERGGEELELSTPEEVRQVFVPVKKVDDKDQKVKVVELPGLSVVLEDGKLTEGSIESLTKAIEDLDEFEPSEFADQPEDVSLWSNLFG